MGKFIATCMGVAAMATWVSAQTPDPKKVEAGKTAFETMKCGTCHSVAGKGGKLASALDGIGAKKSKDEITQWLTDPAPLEAKLSPKPKMPMSNWLKTHKIADPDKDALVAYMMSLK